MKCQYCKAVLPSRDNNPTYPFCSKRCKMADLGRWFGGEYVLSRPVNPETDREAFEALVLAAPGEENV
ncbi:MAG: DNA gyrase inhibitor YacG [Myxococcota bacterium]|nr:DNA gyrase inhibitor YacG [Myxococcota bacterium]